MFKVYYFPPFLIKHFNKIRQENLFYPSVKRLDELDHEEIHSEKGRKCIVKTFGNHQRISMLNVAN